MHPNGTLIGERVIGPILERLPTTLQEKAMLRIHKLGFARVDAEELSIEQIHVSQNRTGSNIRGTFGKFASARHLQLFNIEMRNGFNTVDLVAPKLVDALRSRESARHANDGDSSEQGGRLTVSHRPPPERRLRKRVKASRCRWPFSCASTATADADLARLRCCASLRIVENSNRSVIGTCVCSAFCRLECTATSSRESPPRSKKFWSSPTSGTFRMRCQSCVRVRSSSLSGLLGAAGSDFDVASSSSKAARSIFPCWESGRNGSATKNAGIMCCGNCDAIKSRNCSGVTMELAGTKYATRRLLPFSIRAATQACFTCPCRRMALSISAGSIRCPRIFTWSSKRPKYSIEPSLRHRARSPVRYMRCLG